MTQINQIQKRKLTMQTKQIPENKELLKKTDYKAKITDIGNKLSRISGLATTVALNAVESNTPNFSNLVKKKNRL